LILGCVMQLRAPSSKSLYRWVMRWSESWPWSESWDGLSHDHGLSLVLCFPRRTVLINSSIASCDACQTRFCFGSRETMDVATSDTQAGMQAWDGLSHETVRVTTTVWVMRWSESRPWSESWGGLSFPRRTVLINSSIASCDACQTRFCFGSRETMDVATSDTQAGMQAWDGLSHETVRVTTTVWVMRWSESRPWSESWGGLSLSSTPYSITVINSSIASCDACQTRFCFGSKETMDVAIKRGTFCQGITKVSCFWCVCVGCVPVYLSLIDNTCSVIEW
jgi:hypothetical protein